ncbi:HAD-IA family hydrolase [Patescibacteria group bacterium]
MKEDISREGLTSEKLLQPLYLLRPKNNHAIAKVQEFTQIRLQRINELLGKDYKGAILDIDECTAPHHGEILPENLEHVVEMIQDGTRVVIFSNMKASDRYNAIIDATNGAVKVHTSQFAKPDARGFLECCDELNLLPHEVVMIGDNFITDGGSIRAGIDFIKVEPIKTEGESIGKKLKRLPQTATRWFYSKLSNLYDKISKRKVLKPDDISPKSS